MIGLIKCLLGYHDWYWVAAHKEQHTCRFCRRCPAMIVHTHCGSENPGSHILLCERCGEEFCWGILYGVTCPSCGYCAEEEDNAVDQSV